MELMQYVYPDRIKCRQMSDVVTRYGYDYGGIAVIPGANVRHADGEPATNDGYAHFVDVHVPTGWAVAAFRVEHVAHNFARRLMTMPQMLAMMDDLCRTSEMTDQWRDLYGEFVNMSNHETAVIARRNMQK